MKIAFLCSAALLSGIGLAGDADAQVTVTPTAPGYTGSTTDLFDARHGATVTSSTPTVDGGGVTGVGFPAINAIGGQESFSDQTIFRDGSDATESFTFMTSAPITIGGVALLLAEDGDSTTRGFQAVSLFGSADGTNFTQLFTQALGTASYAASYGSNSITVNAAFAPVSAQYFRFDGTPFAASSFNGGRIIELDAVVGTITPSVPEPATWGLMLVGFGAMGYAMRRRAKVRTNVRFA